MAGQEVVGEFIWDREYARAVDQLTSERFLLPAVVLMENAGRGVAASVLELLEDEAEGAPVAVLVGTGNNGADGLVAARWLLGAGADVQVFLVGEGARSPLNTAQLATWQALGQKAVAWAPGRLAALAAAEPIIIDAVLGLGARGPLAPGTAIHEALAEAARLPEKTVVAVDLPSGLDGDCGAAQTIPLAADLTVTFGGRKPALVLAPARDLCGEVLCIDIGFPKAALDAAEERHRPALITPDAQAVLRSDPWSRLGKSANKYDRGHVLIIGGSVGKTGAPLLAAMAALRAGAGWVSVAMPQSAMASLRGDVPREIVFESLFTGEGGGSGDLLSPLALERFLTQRRVRAVVIGPGAVTSPLDDDTLAVLAAFTAGQDGAGRSGGLVVLDAGALHGVAARLAGIKDLAPDPARWLLTPHPGEWTKMGEAFQFQPLTPQAYRQAAELAARLGVSLLYKGATPLLIPGVEGQPGLVSSEGSVALARAGSGDVLAGIAGAHGAIGCEAPFAIVRSLALMAHAAELAADRRGPHAVLARDLIDQLGAVLPALERGEDEEG